MPAIRSKPQFRLGYAEPCIPTPAAKPPSGPEWVHELKHDGYRIVARRSGDRVRLFTRGGFDYTDRYPLIAAGLLALPRVKTATIDGEAVVLDRHGRAVFDRIHNRVDDHLAVLFAFDLLELNGAPWTEKPLIERKARLEKLLTGAEHLRYNEHFEEDGATVFRLACKLKLEGIVSKRRDLPYRGGNSKSWLKVKNPDSPAMWRVRNGSFF